jgi:hypothetical protein
MRGFVRAVLALLAVAASGAQAEEATAPAAGIRQLACGALLHDQSPFTDGHEEGLDLNVEVLFRLPGWKPWRWLLSPSPHLGSSVNLGGETSYAYGGLTWTAEPAKRLVAAAAVGPAVHDGPLHKPEDSRRHGDKGFGSRALFRLAGEIGVRVGTRTTIALVVDHLSQGGLLAGENEGIDNIGLRWHYAF